MNWKIEISKTAEKQIRRLDKIVQKRIIFFLKERVIGVNPREKGKALRGDKAELWRYRVGDYRLICLLEDIKKSITILEVGHRKEIYK